MIKRKFIVNGLVTVVLAFVGLISTNVSFVKADDTNVRIQGTDCYTSPEQIPTTATIDGVKCTLVSREHYYYQSAHSPSEVEYCYQKDMCNWNMYDYTMHFSHGVGWEWRNNPNNFIKSAKVGSRTYRFSANPVFHEYKVDITTKKI